MANKTGIQRAVEMFDGSPTRLAEAVGNGLLRQHVEHWLKKGWVSVERCVAIERATNGAVSRRDLRPNDWQEIWPELAQPSTSAEEQGCGSPHANGLPTPKSSGDSQ